MLTHKSLDQLLWVDIDHWWAYMFYVAYAMLFRDHGEGLSHLDEGSHETRKNPLSFRPQTIIIDQASVRA